LLAHKSNEIYVMKFNFDYKKRRIHTKLLSYALLIFTITLSPISCSPYQEYEIIGTTEQFTITSSIVADNFLIQTYLPPTYSTTDSSNYPLIIGLDGDNEFESVAAIVSELIEKGDLEPSIFVGIGYGSNEQNDVKRNRDYTPTATEDVEDSPTGGAPDFYRFIRDDLLPQLKNEYKIEDYQHTLLGHSYGGLFTYYAMFQQDSLAPNPFDKFIPAAPSLWYDGNIIFELEEQYFEQNNDFNGKIYTTMGALEGGSMVASFEEMIARLENRNYANLSLEYQILDNYGHSRSDYITFENGLKYVFQP